MLFFSIVIFLYAVLIFIYFRGFQRAPRYISSDAKLSYPVSIIISTRNPNKKLPALLEQLNNQISGVDFEIIIIDDHSTIWVEMKDYDNLSILRLAEHDDTLSSDKNNKKQALEIGVKNSQYDTIICLDSDVTLHPNWWKTISSFVATHSPKFAAGIHQYEFNPHFLSRFLKIEQDVLTAISISSLYMGIPSMCNGANMIFNKKAFQEVEPYKGKYHIAGGDDMFLYHSIYKKYPKDTYYIKSLESSVSSTAPTTLADMLKQRSRWLSKSFAYDDIRILLQMSLIFIVNAIVFSYLIYIGPITSVGYLIFSKFLIDFLFINSIQSFFKSSDSVVEIFLCVVLYPIYTVVLAAYILISKVLSIFTRK